MQNVPGVPDLVPGFAGGSIGFPGDSAPYRFEFLVRVAATRRWHRMARPRDRSTGRFANLPVPPSDKSRESSSRETRAQWRAFPDFRSRMLPEGLP